MNYTRLINSLIVTVVYYACFIGLLIFYVIILIVISNNGFLYNHTQLITLIFFVKAFISPSILTGVICKFKNFDAYSNMIFITVGYFFIGGGLTLVSVWLFQFLLNDYTTGFFLMIVYIVPSFLVIYYFIPHLIKEPDHLIFEGSSLDHN